MESILRTKKYYQIEVNYKNSNMPDKWVAWDSVEYATYKEAKAKLGETFRPNPRTLLMQIVLVVEDRLVMAECYSPSLD